MGAAQQRAVDHESIGMGECRYDTIVIQAASRFANTPLQSRRRLNYSPDLKWSSVPNFAQMTGVAGSKNTAK
jgi:hypothetical protein